MDVTLSKNTEVSDGFFVENCLLLNWHSVFVMFRIICLNIQFNSIIKNYNKNSFFPEFMLFPPKSTLNLLKNLPKMLKLINLNSLISVAEETADFKKGKI